MGFDKSIISYIHHYTYSFTTLKIFPCSINSAPSPLLLTPWPSLIKLYFPRISYQWENTWCSLFLSVFHGLTSYFLYFFKFVLKIQFVNNVVLISGIQLSDSILPYNAGWSSQQLYSLIPSTYFFISQNKFFIWKYTIYLFTEWRSSCLPEVFAIMNKAYINLFF